MWELDHKEAWEPKNWCFQTVVWFLRVSWTIRKSNQSILKKTNPEYSLERLILKLKLQHSGHLIEEPNHWRRLNLGKIAGKRRSRQQRMRWLDDITDSRDMRLSKFWETVKDRDAWHASVLEVANSWTWLSNWTTTTKWISSIKMLVLDFPGSPVVKNPLANAGDTGSIPDLGGFYMPWGN